MRRNFFPRLRLDKASTAAIAIKRATRSLTGTVRKKITNMEHLIQPSLDVDHNNNKIRADTHAHLADSLAAARESKREIATAQHPPLPQSRVDNPDERPPVLQVDQPLVGPCHGAYAAAARVVSPPDPDVGWGWRRKGRGVLREGPGRTGVSIHGHSLSREKVVRSFIKSGRVRARFLGVLRQCSEESMHWVHHVQAGESPLACSTSSIRATRIVGRGGKG